MRYDEPLRPGNGSAQEASERRDSPRSLNVSRRRREQGAWRGISDSFRAITGARRPASRTLSREDRRAVESEWRAAERAQERGQERGQERAWDRDGADDGRARGYGDGNGRDGRARATRRRPDPEYAGYRPERGRLAQGWRDFTSSVRALSTQLPGIGRRGEGWEDDHDGWRDETGFSETGFNETGFGWHSVGDSARFPASGFDGTGSVAFPSLGGYPRRFRFLGWNIPYAVLALLAIVSLVLGFLGTAAIVRVADLGLAALDAKSQVSYIQGALKNTGDVLSSDGLAQMKTRLGSLSKDMQRIEADLPGATTSGGVGHLLRMGQYLAQAGILGIDAPITLLPALKGMMSGLSDTSQSATQNAPPKATAPPLTLDKLRQVATDVNTAGALVQLALKERAQVQDSDLQSLGLGSLVPTLHKLDSVAPKLDTYLGYANVAMSALPGLLGLTGQESSFLMFSMDSDELRPTGGFLGNYAVVTLANGKLKDPVHLRDIYSLDCPSGIDSCFSLAIPEKFAWFRPGFINLTHEFNLRDSNLDPDVPSSALLAEQLGVAESLPDMNGVVWFTPGLIQRILQVTGPIKIDTFGRTITPDNLQDTIHYFHILSAYCDNDQHKGDVLYAKCKDLLGAVGSASALQTSDRKAFDALLGSALLHDIGALPPSQQGKLFKAILDAMQAKDLVVYLNDPGIEGLLTSFKLDDAVQAPPGDSLFVVDTNVGATYVNGDVKEQISDTITLNADGSASHDLALSYDYPIVPHSWSDIYVPSDGVWDYHDFVRAITPQGIVKEQIGQFADHCRAFPIRLQQDGHDVLGCYFTLNRADQLRCRIPPCYTTTNVVHLRWTVPNAVTKTNGVSQYNLFVQKQPGTHSTVAVTIILPDGTKLQQPPADPLKAGANGQLQFSGPLDKDLSLAVSFS